MRCCEEDVLIYFLARPDELDVNDGVVWIFIDSNSECPKEAWARNHLAAPSAGTSRLARRVALPESPSRNLFRHCAGVPGSARRHSESREGRRDKTGTEFESKRVQL